MNTMLLAQDGAKCLFQVKTGTTKFTDLWFASDFLLIYLVRFGLDTINLTNFIGSSSGCASLWGKLMTQSS